MVFANVTDDPRPGSVKVTLKGEDPYLANPDIQYVGTWNFKRVDRTDPGVASCP